MKQLLVFIMFSTLLCWLMFSPVYRHVVVVQHASLQKEVDYLLEVGASGMFGYIGSVHLNDSRQRLQDVGFDPAKITYTVSSTTGNSGTSEEMRIPRGEGLIIEISYPYGTIFHIDRLIGLPGQLNTTEMKARGIKMSEYVG